MLAFHGKQEVKDFYLDRVRAHRAADELIHGAYWQEGRGCAVGCTIHGSSHARYETELGIPRVLARLEDGIFEGLDRGLAQQWPERFLEAIPVGADLSMVFYQFMHWLLSDEQDGVIRFATDRTRPQIQAVIDLFARSLTGERPNREEWRAAAAAADAAAAAADADAAAAAAAADAAAAAAADAADADAAAYAAARLTAREKQSEKLLELLAAAPVAVVV